MIPSHKKADADIDWLNSKIDQLGVGPIKIYSFGITLTDQWQNTGFKGGDQITAAQNGSYLIQFYIDDSKKFWGAYFTGVMSWRAQYTNDTISSEIPLQCNAHALNHQQLYARIQLRSNGLENKFANLQVKNSSTLDYVSTITLKYRKII